MWYIIELQGNERLNKKVNANVHSLNVRANVIAASDTGHVV